MITVDKSTHSIASKDPLTNEINIYKEGSLDRIIFQIPFKYYESYIEFPSREPVVIFLDQTIYKTDINHFKLID